MLDKNLLVEVGAGATDPAMTRWPRHDKL